MDTVTLVTTAITLATPYLIKTGEKIAGKAGEDLWQLIKKPFSQKEQENLLLNSSEEQIDIEVLKKALIEKVQNDEIFQKELKNAITAIQNNDSKQNIVNNGTVEKQINIQTISGNIQM